VLEVLRVQGGGERVVVPDELDLASEQAALGVDLLDRELGPVDGGGAGRRVLEILPDRLLAYLTDCQTI
jgi:hypothetical protein